MKIRDLTRDGALVEVPELQGMQLVRFASGQTSERKLRARIKRLERALEDTTKRNRELELENRKLQKPPPRWSDELPPQFVAECEVFCTQQRALGDELSYRFRVRHIPTGIEATPFVVEHCNADQLRARSAFLCVREMEELLLATEIDARRNGGN